MDYEFAIKGNFRLDYTKTKRVAMAGGGELTIDAVINNATYNI